MSHKSKVAIIGNAGIDTNIYLPGQEIDFTVEANFTENIDYVGQAGGYASRGYARLGYQAAYIGYFGQDFHGRHILETFTRQGIDTRATFVDPQGTARSVNMLYPDGRRKNFYDGKSHMDLKPDLAACRAVMENIKLAHFNIPNWARELLPLAKSAGTKIICDIQDLTDPADPYRQDFIHYADILFLSASNFNDPGPLLRELYAQNPGKIMIAGMGSLGCAAITKKGLQYFEPVDLPEPVIDTNGAGDSLAVGFSSSYILEGYTLEQAILRGQIAARHVCSLKANTDDLITRSQLDHWYNQKQMFS